MLIYVPITVMSRPSSSLPERIQSLLPEPFDLQRVPRIPVTTKPAWHHLLFDAGEAIHHEPQKH